MKNLFYQFFLITASLLIFSSLSFPQTTFTFGGYVKLDMMQSQFHNGTVPVGAALRDFHFPAAIPVGGSSDVFSTIDYHAKESRFNLGTDSKIGEHKLTSFVEMDFLLAGQGDERVSNSFNPRLRHFYFTFDQCYLDRPGQLFKFSTYRKTLISQEPQTGSFLTDSQ